MQNERLKFQKQITTDDDIRDGQTLTVCELNQGFPADKDLVDVVTELVDRAATGLLGYCSCG